MPVQLDMATTERPTTFTEAVNQLEALIYALEGIDPSTDMYAWMIAECLRAIDRAKSILEAMAATEWHEVNEEEKEHARP